ncbi:MAG: hemerythrin domain-containing protein [Candidatus Omnitrophica bacterium]|nr:hemerythrin domain-containing protein [Candidatus Omnitrophota bacterium]
MKIIKITLSLILPVVFWQNISFSHPEATNDKEHVEKAAEVSAVEDLMREHGVLRRLLLIYEEIYRSINKNRKVENHIILETSGIVRDFIENYHEKLEEEYIFSKFKKGEKFFNTSVTLKKQHDAGRRITGNILRLSEGEIKDIKKQKELMRDIVLFIRMYRPHAAREDTVLFPVFKETITEKEYDKLGDKFEEREIRLFGKKGFEGVVGRVAVLEKKLGIYDLSQFTPSNHDSK